MKLLQATGRRHRFLLLAVCLRRHERFLGCSLDVAEEVCVDDEVLLLGGDSDGEACEKTNGYM